MYIIAINVNGEEEDEEDFKLPEELYDLIDGVVYKKSNEIEIFAIIKWLLENKIQYYPKNDPDDIENEYLFMLEEDAMKFKMRWL